MTTEAELRSENTALRQRLSRLSEAGLRITEDLELETVLREVLESARALTGAEKGGVITLDDSGQVGDFYSSGISDEAHQLFTELPHGLDLFNHLSLIAEPIRLADFTAHTAELGLPALEPPLGPLGSFLSAPLRHRGRTVGHVYLSDKEGGSEFTPVDEETLVLFASQAAMAIANARRLQDERRARTDLEALIDTSPVGVVLFDAQTGMPLSMNLETRRIFDRLREPEQTPEQLLEVLTIRRADGREFSLGEYTMAQALSSAQTIRAEEILLQAPDGRQFTAVVNATPIDSAEDGVESVVVTLQDIAAREDLERMRSEFLAMVSHELRGPLSSIKGSAATLTGSGANLDPAATAQFHRIIEEQADYMHDLITDLLDVARIEAGALTVAPQPTDVGDLFERARSAFLSTPESNAISIDMPLDLPWVMADRQRIAQVLGNLLTNASRHSSLESTITLSATETGVQVEFCVSDDGVGIAADQLPFLFRKFSRGDRDAAGGRLREAGLGLAICKGIIEAHGGRIWAESDGIGLGAQFRFTLPAADAAGHAILPEAVPAIERPGIEGGKRLRILVVDDDPMTLRTVRDALAKAGYEPILTGDPNAVSRLISERRPHLVVLDLMLPEIDGIELLERVAALSELPVIFLSAYGGERRVTRALEMGADDYIVKPFSPTELVARIQTVLRRWTAVGTAEPTEPYVHEDLRIDYAERRVWFHGDPLKLTDLEYRMLFELSSNAGRVLSHSELLQRVWGRAHSGRPGAVRTVIKQLRRKLEENADSPVYVFNEPRVGYRMAKPTLIDVPDVPEPPGDPDLTELSDPVEQLDEPQQVESVETESD